MAHDKTQNEKEAEDMQTAGATMNLDAPAVQTDDKREICRNFQRNRCNKGDMCKYLHVAREPRSSRSKSRDRDRRGRSRSRGRRDRSRSPMACRDYERGICNRGKNCRYFHPDDGRDVRQKTIEVCRKFLKDECDRTDCRFLHVTQNDEDLFVQSGQVSNGIIDQAVRLALDSSISIGTGKPACRRFVYESCREPCKFSHVPLNELERILCMSIVTEFEREFGVPQRSMNSLMGNNFGMGAQFDIGMGMNNNMGGGNFNQGMAGSRWNDNGNMGANDDIQGMMNENRRNMEMINQLQRELKDMEGKMMQYQGMDDESRKAQTLLQTAQMEKQTMKDALTRAEEFSNYFKNQVQVLTDEMKVLDSSKMELGIIARRVLNDLPAMEAKIVPAWSGGQATPDVQHWQGIAQNLRSLIQTILGLDVNSLNASNQQQSVGSANTSQKRDSYGSSDNRGGDKGARSGARGGARKEESYNSGYGSTGGDNRYAGGYGSQQNEQTGQDQQQQGYGGGWNSQYSGGSTDRSGSSNNAYQANNANANYGYGSAGWK